MSSDLQRYAVISDKNPREIVLLRGTGCAWKKCTFCDYHLDCSPDVRANSALNAAVLRRVTGQFGRLEVINSGSFCDLDAQTWAQIEQVCVSQHIRTVHVECHWMHRREIPALRARLAARGIAVKVKIGVETFDRAFREGTLCKGIGVSDPAAIAELFDECCLLFGLTGQTVQRMTRDIETGLAHFERVCINIMTPNTTAVAPDPAVIADFMRAVYPRWRDDARVDILLGNTDFGVGGLDA